MSILQKLSDNKIGITLVIVHWTTLLFALYGYLSAFGGNGSSKSELEIILVILILISDLPAIVPAALLWLPVYLLAENETNVFYGFAVTSFFTITFQWLIFGQAIYNTFSAKAAKPISLSLND